MQLKRWLLKTAAKQVLSAFWRLLMALSPPQMLPISLFCLLLWGLRFYILRS